MSGIILRQDFGGELPVFHLLADSASADYLWDCLQSTPWRSSMAGRSVSQHCATSAEGAMARAPKAFEMQDPHSLAGKRDGNLEIAIGREVRDVPPQARHDGGRARALGRACRPACCPRSRTA